MLSQPDGIAELNKLAFATRLKRRAERLQRDVTLLYQKLEIEFEARWFTLVYLLYHRAPLTITALALALGLTHTAINQFVRELIQKGLVGSTRGKEESAINSFKRQLNMPETVASWRSVC
jgi:DNA-binding MarR family transcriptional regulator